MTNTLPVEIETAISNSPVFKAITAELNQLVELFNSNNEVMPKELRDSLSATRALKTIKDDPQVFELYKNWMAREIWNTVNA